MSAHEWLAPSSVVERCDVFCLVEKTLCNDGPFGQDCLESSATQMFPQSSKLHILTYFD